MKQPDPQHWTPYWANPFLTSFRNIFPANYDDSIRAFWEEQLADEPAHILDVACGNGALAWLCNDILNADGPKTTITGIDFADIRPFETLERKPADFPAVRFIGNTPAEHLPLADRSTDLAISQFGIEYTDLEKSIPELSRVLKRNGRMCFILHDKESDIIREATRHLADYRWLLDESALHEAVNRLDDLYRRVHGPEPGDAESGLEDAEKIIRAETEKIRARMTGMPEDSPLNMYLERLRQIQEFARANQPADRKPLFEYTRHSLAAVIGRIEDLANAAQSAQDRRHLGALIEKEGFRILQTGQIEYKSHSNIGSMLVAGR